MSEQHWSAVIYIGDYQVTGELSDCVAQSAKLASDKSFAAQQFAGKLSKLTEKEEMELQAVDAELDMNEPLEEIPAEGDGEEGEDGQSAPEPVQMATGGVTTEQRLEAMQEKQSIQNKYSNEQATLNGEAKVVEDNYNWQIESNKTRMQELETRKQTFDDYLDQTNMKHC